MKILKVSCYKMFTHTHLSILHSKLVPTTSGAINALEIQLSQVNASQLQIFCLALLRFGGFLYNLLPLWVKGQTHIFYRNDQRCLGLGKKQYKGYICHEAHMTCLLRAQESAFVLEKALPEMNHSFSSPSSSKTCLWQALWLLKTLTSLPLRVVQVKYPQHTRFTSCPGAWAEKGKSMDSCFPNSIPCEWNRKT